MRLLVTGASGMLGTYLLPELLKDGHECIILMHNDAPSLEGVRVVRGDVRQYELGIEEDLRVDGLVHAAAVVSFSRKDRKALEHVNVGGTLNALRFCQDRDIPLFYISTAYVCGDFKGLMMPSSLIMGQRHRNYYEVTKYLAEKVIRESQVDFAIMRPSVLVGDSRVSGLPPLAGYYVVVKALDAGKRLLERRLGLPHMELVIRIKGSPQATVNLIPVDVAARQIADVIKTNVCGSFHITNPSPPTLNELAVVVSDVVGAEIEFQERLDDPNPAERVVERMLGGLRPYLSGEPTFDLRSTKKVVMSECQPLTSEFIRDTTRHFLTVQNRPAAV